MEPSPATANAALLSRVSVVGSIVTPELLEAVGTLPLAESCDLVEFRLDAYPDATGRVRDAIQRLSVPALITARDPLEGGQNGLGFSPRRALLTSLVDDAALVDVEVANLRLFGDVVQQAIDSEVPVVASFHDFHAMPPLDMLRDKIARALDEGSTAVKFAVTPQSVGDVAALASLMENAPCPLALMGMGRFGRISRLLLAQLGSCLNYGFLDRATVRGQWSARELKRLVGELRADDAAAR